MDRSGSRGLSPLVAAALLTGLVGCGGPAASPSVEPDPGAYLLRATVTQAIAPENLFGWVPAVTVTGDRILVATGPVPAIFPGPLLPNLRGREISQVGYDRIVGEARAIGLLDGDGDFTPPDAVVGGQAGRIELLVDGEMRELIGDPARVIQCVREPCVPPPGTPEAFGAFWQQLQDLGSVIGEELGPEFAYRPDGYALLIGVEPMDEAGLQPRIQEWPLETALADIGRPIGDRLVPRCGTVRGDDAATLTTAFASADQLTRWVDEGGGAADAVVISVRPLLPGEDVCRDLFGIEE